MVDLMTEIVSELASFLQGFEQMMVNLSQGSNFFFAGLFLVALIGVIAFLIRKTFKSSNVGVIQ